MGGDDDDVSLPKATIGKVIKEHLNPDNIRCANDTRDLIVDCCVEFVQMIATEANDMCTKDKKKTISAEHVIEALKKLGYPEYINEVNEVNDEHKIETQRQQKISKKNKNSQFTEEELIEQQKNLIEQSRQRTQPNTPTHTPMSPFQPPMNATNTQQVFQPKPLGSHAPPPFNINNSNGQ